MKTTIKYSDEYIRNLFSWHSDSERSFKFVTSSAFYAAVRCIVYAKHVGTTVLQRHLQINYGRAAVMLDYMEELGLIKSVYYKGDDNILPNAKQFLDDRSQFYGNEECPLQIPNGISSQIKVMTGKEKCELLKRIRREIARANGIEYETTDCTFQGDCYGFCPKCDSEVMYLERELQKKAQEGENIQLTGLAYTSFLDTVEQKAIEKIESIEAEHSKSEKTEEDLCLNNASEGQLKSENEQSYFVLTGQEDYFVREDEEDLDEWDVCGLLDPSVI